MNPPLPGKLQPVLAAVADELQGCRRILFITGAGISAESGLPTYRGIGGLYNGRLTDLNLPIETVLSGEMMQRQPEVTWKYLAEIERACRGALPNRAHRIIAQMERVFEGVCVLTQNVDGFHQAAGSGNVIDIHGTMHDLYCPGCNFAISPADYSRLALPPICPECGLIMRPDVILFGEFLKEEKTRRLATELDQGFDMIFSIGTSSIFPYITSPILAAARRGIPTVEINPAETGISAYVRYRIPAGAGAALQHIWDAISSLTDHGSSTSAEK